MAEKKVEKIVSAMVKYATEFLKNMEKQELKIKTIIKKWESEDNLVKITEAVKKALPQKRNSNPDRKKRIPSAYMLFCKEVRPQVVKDNPDMKFGEIAKELGILWANQEDKSKWEKESAALKGPAEKNSKPKRAKTSFLFFSDEKRPEIKKKNPEMKFGEIAKELGKMWANQEDKSKWENMAEKAKEKHRAELEEWKNKEKSDSDKESDKEENESDDEMEVEKEKEKSDSEEETEDEKEKTGLSKFVSSKMAKLKEKYPTVDESELMKKIKEKWSKLSEAERLEYE